MHRRPARFPILSATVLALGLTGCDAEMFTIIPDDGQISRPVITDAGSGVGRPVPGQSGYSGATALPAQNLAATLTHSASCDGRTEPEGGQGFLDIGLQRCYACPRGYNRTIFHVESASACQRWASLVEAWGPDFRYAVDLGRPGCTGPAEFEYGANCYTCPGGTRRDGSGARCVSG